MSFDVQCNAMVTDEAQVWIQTYNFPGGISFDWFYVPRCQHDDGFIDGRSLIKVHTDERTQRSVFPDGHPSKY